jgi:hypothetical protein
MRIVAILVLLGISIPNMALPQKEQAAKNLFLGRWAGEIVGRKKAMHVFVDMEEAYRMKIVDLVISEGNSGCFNLAGVVEIDLQEPKWASTAEGVRVELLAPKLRMLARVEGLMDPKKDYIYIDFTDESRDAWNEMLGSWTLKVFYLGELISEESGDPHLLFKEGTFRATGERIALSHADSLDVPPHKHFESHSGELRRFDIERCKKWSRVSLTTIVSAETKESSNTLPEGATVHTTSETIKIETPDDGCAELVLKDQVRIVTADGSLYEILISKALVGLISSTLYEGGIQVDVWKDGKHHTFSTPNAVVDVEKATFTLEVSEDGATIVTTLDGDIELSDLEKKQTITVGKSQMSIVGSDGLPCEPLTVNPDHLRKWSE